MTANEFQKYIGAAFKELREAEDITQEHLANIAGFDRTYVGAVERGERNISMANMYKLSQALGAKPSAVVARAEQLESEDS